MVLMLRVRGTVMISPINKIGKITITEILRNPSFPILYHGGLLKHSPNMELKTLEETGYMNKS